MAGLGAAGASGLFGGPGLAALGAGLLAGVIGGTALVSTGTVQFGGAGAAGGTGGGGGLELFPCPDQAPVVGTIPRNQEVLVTARTEDGTWLQLYWPLPGLERAWTKAGPLKLEGDAADLPVASCEAPPTPTPRPTVEPTPSPTPTPTPSPTPTAAPTATPTPRPNARPKLANLAVSTRTVSYDQGQYCKSDPKTVTFSVTATDADGIAGVTLHYKPPGAAKYLQKPMQLASGRYVATLDTTADNLRTAGELRYYIVAKDANPSPKTTKIPTENSYRMTVKVCKNTGPKITSLKAAPTSIITNPLGVTSCSGSTLTEFQARATDVDGVKSIKLFFKKPGASSYTSRSFSEDGDTWFSFINTVSSVDDIVRSGKIAWYVVATDDKGATTKTAAKTITVTRCDSEASFSAPAGVPAVWPTSVDLPNPATGAAYPAVTVVVAITDRDGAPSATMKWRLTDRSGSATLLSGSVRMSRSGSAYTGVVKPTSAWWKAIGGGLIGRLYFEFSTQDPFGGKSSYSNPTVYNAYVFAMK